MESLSEIIDILNDPEQVYEEEGNELNTSEIFLRGSLIEMTTKCISDDDVVSWLNRGCINGEGDNDNFDLLRVVWIRRTNTTPRITDIKQKTLHLILEHFDLMTPFRLVSDGMFLCLPGRNRHRSNTQYFALGLSGHVAILLWSYNLMTNQTKAVWIGNNDIHPASVIQEVMEHQKRLAKHPMFIASVFAISLSKTIHDVIKTSRETINGVENRTQHCHSSLLAPAVATGSYASLSAIMSGSSTTLSLLEGRSYTLHLVLDTISAYQWPTDIDQPCWKESVERELAECVTILKERLRGQDNRIRYLSRRADIQLTALFNLITQQETQLHISVAQDSRKLASATKDDSTAMKTLAAVTVFFLPGTFVAAFFSMPLFHWNTETAGNSIVSKQIWVYWAVTLPLTFVTLALWLAWMRLQMRRHRIRDSEGRDALDREIGGPPLEFKDELKGLYENEECFKEK